MTVPSSGTGDYLRNNYVLGDLSLLVQLTAITHTVNSVYYEQRTVPYAAEIAPEGLEIKENWFRQQGATWHSATVQSWRTPGHQDWLGSTKHREGHPSMRCLLHTHDLVMKMAGLGKLIVHF